MQEKPALAGFLCGALSAALSILTLFQNFTSFFAIIIFVIAYLSLVPFAIAWRAGPVQGMAATVTLIVLHLILHGPLQTMGGFVLNMLPIILFVTFSKVNTTGTIQIKDKGLGIALSKVALIYAVFAVIAMIFVFDVNSLSPYADALDGKVDGKFFNISRKVVAVLPGVITVASLLNMMVTVYAASRIAQKLTLPHRPFPLPGDFYIPRHWDIVFVLGLMLQLTGIENVVFIGKNLTIISCLPLYCLGLSTVSLWLRGQENGNLWLGLLIVLSLILVWPGMMVVFLGLVEPAMELQKRILLNNDKD